MKYHTSSQRTLALLLVLLMIMSLAPVTAFAATGRTVYFENTASWSTVNIYYWSDSNTAFVTWPGKTMKVYQDKIYSYDLPDGVDYVIFNNGSTQTGDLTLPDDRNLYHYNSATWSQYGCAHTWGEETILTAATCTVGGEVTHTCSSCGETRTVATDPLGHDFSGRVCSRCGLSQTLIFFDSKNSGWTQPYIYTWSGSTAHCGAWPGSKMEAVEGEDGLFVYGLPELPENVIFNNGNGGSGNQTADLTVPADGNNCYHYADGSWSEYDTCQHVWNEGVVTKPATCTDNGELTLTCTLCAEIQMQTITATGHSFENGSCSVCGALEACTEHSWDEGVVTEEQTCWLPGTRTFTCVLCGATKDEYIYPSHDTYVAQVIEPTCTATGKQITKCTRCAYSYDRTLPKIDHTYVAGETVAPTCTEDGYTVYTCEYCAAVTNGDLVYHSGHSWSGNSCTACGEICEHTYSDGICTACGDGGPKYVQGFYEIENAAQLYWFASQVNSGNNAINGKLIADIDLNNGTWTSIGYYLSDTLEPDTVPYTGTFDGQGHTVSNFTTAGTDNEGLFGYCSSATIVNLGVINARVTGWRAGAVAGYALTSNVRNCFAIDCTIIGKTNNSVAMLSGTVYLSPVAGPQGGIVRDCYALNCTLVDDTDLEVYTSPVGGTDTQNGYYCNVTYSADFSSVRNSTEVTMEQLTTGEVTYLLNRGITDGTQGWYQTCGEGLPAHSGMTVYQLAACGNQKPIYTNDPEMPAGHSYQETVTTAATCTTDGIKTYTCSGCGDSYTEVIAAIGHSFTEGACANCGEKDPDYVRPIQQPTLTLAAPTLEFKDMVCVIAFFTAENIEDVEQMGMITYKNQVDEWNVENADFVIPGFGYDEINNRYYASSQGINAKYLGDTVYLACYAKLTDGSYVYTKLAPYSPITYATNQLKNSSDMKLKQLVAAMLNYSAAAQVYFNYNADMLSNATLTEEQKALPDAFRQDMLTNVPAASTQKQGVFANNDGFIKRYPAISFEGAFCINYFFTPAYMPADGITLYYWTGEVFDKVDDLTVENASGTIALAGNGMEQYRGDIEGIAAKNLDQAVYVAAVYSDGTNTWTSGVLGYSIGTYCGSLATKGGDIAGLAMATAVYGYHAKLYFG